GRPSTFANAAVGPTYSTGGSTFNAGFGYYNGSGADLDGGASIGRSFPDGLSNTVMIAEKYAQCTNTIFQAPNFDGGNYWAYSAVAPGSDPSRNAGFRAGLPGSTGALPDTSPLY